MKLPLLLGSLLLSLPGFCFAASTNPRTEKLDAFVASQRYDQVLMTLFPNRTAPQLSPEELRNDIEWLRTRAETGEFPLMYFLSWRLMDSDQSEARKWNARGRIGVMLDAQQCSNSRDPRIIWFQIVEGRILGEISNNMRLRDTASGGPQKEWLLAVDEATHWHENSRPVPSERKGWFCGPANLVSNDQGAIKRHDYLIRLRQSNAEDLEKMR